MDVDHKGLARYLLGMDSGGICEPVVRVDHVIVDGAGYDSCTYGVVVDLFYKVVGVAA